MCPPLPPGGRTKQDGPESLALLGSSDLGPDFISFDIFQQAKLRRTGYDKHACPPRVCVVTVTDVRENRRSVDVTAEDDDRDRHQIFKVSRVQE